MLAEQAAIPLVGRLEAQRIGFLLRKDEGILDERPVHHLYLVVLGGQLQQLVVRQAIDYAVFQCLNHQVRRLLAEEALDAEEIGALAGEMLRQVLLVLVIKEAQHPFINITDVFAYFAFFQIQGVLFYLGAHQYRSDFI